MKLGPNKDLIRQNQDESENVKLITKIESSDISVYRWLAEVRTQSTTKYSRADSNCKSKSNEVMRGTNLGFWFAKKTDLFQLIRFN